MRISDWSSDVCSSDLFLPHPNHTRAVVHDEANVVALVLNGMKQFTLHFSVRAKVTRRSHQQCFGPRPVGRNMLCEPRFGLLTVAVRSTAEDELSGIRQIGRAHV